MILKNFCIKIIIIYQVIDLNEASSEQDKKYIVINLPNNLIYLMPRLIERPFSSKYFWHHDS